MPVHKIIKLISKNDKKSLILFITFTAFNGSKLFEVGIISTGYWIG